MWSQDRHHDVGAYALGVLDEVEAFHFEGHLRECPRCAVQVAEFRPAARQLMLYRRATPRSVHPFAGPGPRLLDRLLDEVGNRNRAGRRRWLFAVAASVVFAVGGPAVAILAGPGEQKTAVAATDTKTGVWAEVKAADKLWGSEIDVQVKDASGPRVCQLVVIGKDGSEETVTSWMAPDHTDTPSAMKGGAAMQREDISHFEVRSDGERLVTLKSPWG
ncbi:zf-HC2 domain-containing protein [Streptomyces phyllanthi]|uniref:Zf-HC2 domain-containing protein n=1 Tax=Streptomyces phyllanthi TaxID=1803180 RepID=A0A5N8VXZ6_9ACTN|nr:zf-HC2 domain-containing protein [Streptomyces phyllanthi]MPY40141.1 zf-HC2 domain-containing protein [Streptomyces phyllanthi]